MFKGQIPLELQGGTDHIYSHCFSPTCQLSPESNNDLLSKLLAPILGTFCLRKMYFKFCSQIKLLKVILISFPCLKYFTSLIALQTKATS